MKIYQIWYRIKGKTGNSSWYDIGNENISVLAPSAERAIEAAKKYALKPAKVEDSETGKLVTEQFKNFELTSIKLIAEADIKA